MESIVLDEAGHKTDILLEKRKIVIAVNLFYEETVEKYTEMLAQYISYADIFIVSSKAEILKQIQKKYGEIFNYIAKVNRGRDISALLVTLRDIIREYDYLCFLHDKRAKEDKYAEDVNFWNENLRTNMIFSVGYINTVIEYMDKGYGLLIPPKPIGKYINSYYTKAWGSNYINVCNLAEHLGLKTKISRDQFDEISLGTVFWCKTAAMKKLFDYSWKYEDFTEEPMPDDGTISHAIERILPFVAMDAGFKFTVVMNRLYAAKLIDIVHRQMQATYLWLNNNLGVKKTLELKQIEQNRSAIINFFYDYEKVYLYGAGEWGYKYLQVLKLWGFTPAGFVVSNGMLNSHEYGGMPVYELQDIRPSADIGIIITTDMDKQEEICSILNKNNFGNYYRIICGD